jgi:hypothetical protein
MGTLMTTSMTIVVPSHPGVHLIDPVVTVVGTIDRPLEQTYQPSVILECGPNICIHYELPACPYVDGTWHDEDVQAAVEAHLASLAI